MFATAPTRTFLDRFVRDLDDTGPRRIEGVADLRGATSEDLEAARLAWASRVVDEYRSVAVFTELLAHLTALEAPYVTLAAVHRLIGDELRHARLCAEVAGWFGPLDELDIDLAGLALPPTDDPPAVRALEIIARELALAERESVRVLDAYRRATTDPACYAVLTLVLADEARHAACGPALFDALLRHVGREAVEDLLLRLPATLDADLRHIAHEHARGAVGGPGRRYGASIEPEEAPCMPR